MEAKRKTKRKPAVKKTEEETLTIQQIETKVHRALLVELGRRYVGKRLTEDDYSLDSIPLFTMSGNAFLLLWESAQKLEWDLVTEFNSTKKQHFVCVSGKDISELHRTSISARRTLPEALLRAMAMHLGILSYSQEENAEDKSC